MLFVRETECKSKKARNGAGKRDNRSGGLERSCFVFTLVNDMQFHRVHSVSHLVLFVSFVCTALRALHTNHQPSLYAMLS